MKSPSVRLAQSGFSRCFCGRDALASGWCRPHDKEFGDQEWAKVGGGKRPARPAKAAPEIDVAAVEREARAERAKMNERRPVRVAGPKVVVVKPTPAPKAPPARKPWSKAVVLAALAAAPGLTRKSLVDRLVGQVEKPSRGQTAATLHGVITNLVKTRQVRSELGRLYVADHHEKTRAA